MHRGLDVGIVPDQHHQPIVPQNHTVRCGEHQKEDNLDHRMTRESQENKLGHCSAINHRHVLVLDPLLERNSSWTEQIVSQHGLLQYHRHKCSKTIYHQQEEPIVIGETCIF